MKISNLEFLNFNLSRLARPDCGNSSNRPTQPQSHFNLATSEPVSSRRSSAAENLKSATTPLARQLVSHPQAKRKTLRSCARLLARKARGDLVSDLSGGRCRL